MNARPTLLLADDEPLLLTGLRCVLSEDFDIVATAGDGRSVLRLVEEHRPAAVILEITLPLLNGLDAARQIRRISPATKIIFLTVHSDPENVGEAFRSGGSGFVLKTAAEEELLDAVRTVLRHAIYVSRTLPDDIRELPLRPWRLRARMEGVLTDREKEVLQLLAEGRSAKEIAGVLCLSVKTVEYHKYRMMKRFGLRTAAELAAYAVHNKLIALPCR